ncbi:class I SAM-dependent methyltransferase [Actinomadura logoneensis]|uniref:Class I SAM-dependent methyltransferase n=1 Tax=Actinomadura logoneensis TaxID=2293572 RepID=A0A372JGQ8_9ACTN|nr:class I SAM-dependent methyltransferase [Actinomadura logoneensis]RFU39006.1 class I SAM-dependent methyltransferase [Actinomadura logoneensis]
MTRCRICLGPVREFVDLGRQPRSDAFLPPGEADAHPEAEFFFRLAAGACADCGMAQLTEPVPAEAMFHRDYPYRTSQSARMSEHFARTARRLAAEVRDRPDPFVVEVGCNDGGILPTLARAGVRHLGVDPSGRAAAEAAGRGARVLTAFFGPESAAEVRAAEGPADLVYSANTVSHVPDLASVFAGADLLLARDGRMVFEDPYLGDILARTAFDQIIDEHVYLFTVGAVRQAARRYGFELVDVEPLDVHGGQLRFTVARPGRYRVSSAVKRTLRVEGLGLAALDGFAARVEHVRDELVALLRTLREQGRRVVGYGATAKSATVTNYCGIGPDLLPFVCDSTPAKQGLVTPGTHIPVRPPAAFADPYPDFALLFAWNHAEEIMAKERAFRAAGGRWIRYVPGVRVV